MTLTKEQVKAVSDEELDLALGHAQGWVTYPTDSVEKGGVFHIEPEKAPFGKTLKVQDYQPTKDWDTILTLMTDYGIPFPDTHFALEKGKGTPQRRLAEYVFIVLIERNKRKDDNSTGV